MVVDGGSYSDSKERADNTLLHRTSEHFAPFVGCFSVITSVESLSNTVDGFNLNDFY